ncbi:MAG: hypothetical protein P4L10_14320 [Acidobacteriaceae bacterium]|nr:hypothetical protein [Acidobacteriaceae bacterium]
MTEDPKQAVVTLTLWGIVIETIYIGLTVDGETFGMSIGDPEDDLRVRL